MSNLKPIEMGCLAMIINTDRQENNGKIVTVLECMGPRMSLIDFKTRIIWKVDYFGPGNVYGEPCNKIRESRLMRIDDPDLKKKPKKSKIFVGSNVEITFNGKPLKGVTVTQHD